MLKTDCKLVLNFGVLCKSHWVFVAWNWSPDRQLSPGIFGWQHHHLFLWKKQLDVLILQIIKRVNFTLPNIYSPWITTTNRAFWSLAVWMASPIDPWNQSMAINLFWNESFKISLLEIQIMKNLNRFDFWGRLETRNFFVDVIFFFQKHNTSVFVTSHNKVINAGISNMKYE